MSAKITLGELSRELDARLVGDENTPITYLDDLQKTGPDGVSFVSNKSYLENLADTKAAAVILIAEFQHLCPTAALIVKDPYLAYAKAAQLLDSTPRIALGIHTSAVIDDSVTLGEQIAIGANVVIESGSKVGDGVSIGAGTVVGQNVFIDAGCKLQANVTLYHDVKIGKRVLIHSGSVVGADGFGFANDKGKWIKIPQMGSVIIGDDVEIGANTTIDRGALNDTLIGNGVKLDNLIHIAHNVEVGDDSAMAAFVGIAGSSKIGSGCTLAGGVSIIGHLDIPDGTHFTVRTLATKSPKLAGSYSSGTLMMENKEWHKNTLRFKKLDKMSKQLKSLENQVQSLIKENKNK